MKKNVILLLLASMTVMVAVSSVVFASDYTKELTYYEKNSNPLFGDSYASTTIKTVSGDVGVERTMTTTTGAKYSGNYEYAYSIGYKGTYKSGSTVENGTYSRKTKGTGQLSSIHIASIYDGAGGLSCQGTMTSATAGCYSWDGTTAEYLWS